MFEPKLNSTFKNNYKDTKISNKSNSEAIHLKAN